ncbi:MAG: hypothetical protein WDM80_13050 [Limisphaerales bacterium]
MSTRVCIDVDLTVVDQNGNLLPGVIQNLKSLKGRGCELILWFYGGGEYAETMARRHQIEDLFVGFSGKPDIAVDDESEKVASFAVVDAAAVKNWDAIGNEVVDLAEVLDEPIDMDFPFWIQDLWNDRREQSVAATKAIWLNQHAYFKWPKKERVLNQEWIRITDPNNRDDLYSYSPNIIQECESAKIPADGRSNGPAIVTFLLSGGARPLREDPPTWGWSIHHIYDGKFPAPHQEGGVLNAVRVAGEFTNSRGLVAAHPVADFVAANSRLLAWLLRWEAFRRFNYDPNRIFLPT